MPNNWTKWQEFLLDNFIDFNPSVQLRKGAQAKKVDMDKLAPYTREITGYTKDIFKSGSKFSNGDTLLARITPCLENGKTAFVNILENDEVAFGSTEFIVLREKEGISDSLFIYYLARCPQFRDKSISFMTGTSGRQRVELTALKSLSFNLPPFDEQKRIAGVLGAFDDKIELLQKQNKTLKDMAKAIFKSWFVDFDIVKAKQRGEDKQKILSTYKITEELYNLFPSSFTDAPASSSLGPIPTGWHIGSLSEKANILSGYAFKSNDFVEEGYPVVKIKNITEHKRVDLSQTEYISEQIADTVKQFMLNDGNIVIAMTGATVGKFGIIVKVDKVAYLNQRVAKITPKNPQNNWYLYVSLLMNSVEEQVKNNALGSAQPNISAAAIGSSTVIVPSDDIISEYGTAINSLFEKLIQNEKQIQTLTELRDGLLPRLLSGKLKV